VGIGGTHPAVEDNVSALNHDIEADLERIEIGAFCCRFTVDSVYGDTAQGLELPAEEMSQKSEVFRQARVIGRYGNCQVSAVLLRYDHQLRAVINEVIAGDASGQSQLDGFDLDAAQRGRVKGIEPVDLVLRQFAL